MHFQIYVPGARDVAPELEKVGLGDFVANAEAMRCDNGPDGKDGAIFAWWNPRCRQIGYRPDDQTWHKSAEGYWVGLWTDSPPTPDELRRPYQEPGAMVTLGDGQRWLVPQIDRLDRDLVLADDGTWKFEVRRRHHQLWLDSLEWASRFAPTADGKQRVSVDLGAMADFVIGVLRLNYRITREIAASLRLLSSNTIAAPFGTIIGVPVTLGVPDGG